MRTDRHSTVEFLCAHGKQRRHATPTAASLTWRLRRGLARSPPMRRRHRGTGVRSEAGHHPSKSYLVPYHGTRESTVDRLGIPIPTSVSCCWSEWPQPRSPERGTWYVLESYESFFDRFFSLQFSHRCRVILRGFVNAIKLTARRDRSVDT